MNTKPALNLAGFLLVGEWFDMKMASKHVRSGLEARSKRSRSTFEAVSKHVRSSLEARSKRSRSTFEAVSKHVRSGLEARSKQNLPPPFF